MYTNIHKNRHVYTLFICIHNSNMYLHTVHTYIHTYIHTQSHQIIIHYEIHTLFILFIFFLVFSLTHMKKNEKNRRSGKN